MKIIVTIVPEIKENLKPGFYNFFSFLQNQGNSVELLLYKESIGLWENSTLFNQKGSAKNIIKGFIPFLQIGLSNLKWLLRLSKWNQNRSFKKIIVTHFSSLVFFDIYLKTQKPDVILIWNPFCYAFGLLNEVAKKKRIKTLTIEWGPFENTIYIDNNGSQTLTKFANSDLSKLKAHANSIVSFSYTVANQYKQEPTSEFWEKIQNIPNKRRILILGTSEVDSGVVPNWHSDRKLVYPYFKNGYDCAIQTAKITISDSIVIFKPHPSHNQYSNLKQERTNLYVLDVSPEILIDWADIVVASATKLELMVVEKGKVLILPGQGILLKKKVAFEPSTFSEYKDLLISSNLTPSMDLENNYQHIVNYLKKTLVDLVNLDKEILNSLYQEHFIK